MKKKHFKLLAGIAILCFIAFILFSVKGYFAESFAAAAMGAAMAGAAQRSRTVYKLEDVEINVDEALEENNETRRELEVISGGVEDAEEKYLNDIKKMTLEEKKALADRLFKNKRV